MRVLMISGDVHVIKNLNGPFNLTLSELSKYWDSIDVLCPNLTGHKRQLNEKVKLIGVRKFLLFLDLYKILKSNQYDLIVTHDYGLMLNGLSVFVLRSFFKIPHISEIHHIEGYPQAVSIKERIYAILGKIYVRFVVKYLHGVRVDNQGDIVQLLTKLGVCKSKILYIPPIYLELDKYRPLNTEKEFDAIFVGRLVHNKGIFTILNAVKILQKKNILIHLKLKGRGPLEEEINAFIKENKLENQVHIDKSILDEEQLITLYNKAKILICASTVEGGPRVTLEAMACNIPVISTPCGIMPEVINNNDNGIIFDGSEKDLAAKIENLLTNSELLQKLQQNSRNSVLKYDYKITLKNYAEKYIECLDQ